MPTSTTVKGLNINELTEAQYDAAVLGGVIGTNELSIITDLSDSIQVSSMPVAGAGNLGDILQYVGSTDATYTNGYFYKNIPTYTNPSATISQTIGSGLTDLAVVVATFESAEQPSGDETVNFVAASVSESIDPTQFQFDTATIEIDPATFLSMKTSVYGGDWANVARIYLSYDGDNNSFGAAAYDADNNELGSSGGLNPTVWGINVVSGTLPSSGSWGTNLYYTPAGIQWSKGGETVTLADYGISFTGAPNDGDVLTVAYTAPVINSYTWEQIDVQPSSGQAIEYDDIDYVYGTDPSETSIYFELENLTTGDYYFYVKSKKLSDSQGGNFAGFQTHKVSFHWDSTWNGQDPWPVVRSFIVSPVLEGDFIGSPNDSSSAFQTQNLPALECYFNNNTENKFGIKMVNWLVAQTGYFYQNEPSVYKVSKLYGGGSPITMTLTKVQRYGSIPNYASSAGCGNTTPLVKDAVLPNKKSIQSYAVSSFSSEDSIALLGNLSLENSNTNTTQLHFSCGCKYGDFVGDVVYNIDGGTTQQITKATGPFVASRFYINPNGEIYVSFDSAEFAALQDQNDTVYMSAGIYGTVGTTEITIGVYEESLYPSIVDGATRIPFVSGGVSPVLDTPILGEYENIVQYIGETDANYTNGYFYKANGTVITVPASITCTENSATGTTITCTGSGAENLIADIKTQTGWDDVTTLYFLNDQNNLWTYDADNDIFSWSVLGGIPSNWIQYFTFSPAVASGTISWKTSNTTPEHEELQNGTWVQTDVQPGGGLSNNATGNNSLSILGAGTNKDNCVEVGVGATASDSQATVAGRSAQGGYDSVVTGYSASGANYSAVYGYNANAYYKDGIAYGREAVSNAIGAIQIGKGTNADAGTLKIGQTTDGTNWTNIELLTAAGLIPADRIASTTGLADGNYRLRLTMTSGVPTLSWVAE